MTPKQRLRVIVVVSSLLLLGCIETGWAGRDPVLDDDGNVIMETEIEENMGKGYRIGCVIGGVGLSAFPVFGGLGYLAYLSGEYGWWIPSSVAVEVAVIIASYYAGKRFDRSRAIKRIKTQRRQHKEHAFGKQEMSDGFRLQLLKVTF